MGTSDLYPPYAAGEFISHIEKKRNSVKGLLSEHQVGRNSLNTITGRAWSRLGLTRVVAAVASRKLRRIASGGLSSVLGVLRDSSGESMAWNDYA